ncbi:MAG: hypothetical protein ACC700_15220 [Anaerolineales bacterium]
MQHLPKQYRTPGSVVSQKGMIPPKQLLDRKFDEVMKMDYDLSKVLAVARTMVIVLDQLILIFRHPAKVSFQQI